MAYPALVIQGFLLPNGFLVNNKVSSGYHCKQNVVAVYLMGHRLKIILPETNYKLLGAVGRKLGTFYSGQVQETYC